MENTTQTTCFVDPVCGMEIEPENAVGKSDYEGVTYYFCCQGCKEEFDEHPGEYA